MLLKRNFNFINDFCLVRTLLLCLLSFRRLKIYRVAQKSFDTRDNILNMEIQVVFAPLFIK